MAFKLIESAQTRWRTGNCNDRAPRSGQERSSRTATLRTATKPPHRNTPSTGLYYCLPRYTAPDRSPQWLTLIGSSWEKPMTMEKQMTIRDLLWATGLRPGPVLAVRLVVSGSPRRWRTSNDGAIRPGGLPGKPILHVVARMGIRDHLRGLRTLRRQFCLRLKSHLGSCLGDRSSTGRHCRPSKVTQ